MIFKDEHNEISAEVIGIGVSNHFMVRLANDANDETYALLHYKTEAEAIESAKQFCGIIEQLEYAV